MGSLVIRWDLAVGNREYYSQGFVIGRLRHGLVFFRSLVNYPAFETVGFSSGASAVFILGLVSAIFVTIGQNGAKVRPGPVLGRDIRSNVQI